MYEHHLSGLVQKLSDLLHTFLIVGKVTGIFHSSGFCWPMEPVSRVNNKILSFPGRWPLTHSPSAALTQYALTHKLQIEGLIADTVMLSDLHKA